MAGKILVTGATGTVGSALVRELQIKKIPFAAAVRDLSKGRDILGQTIELVSFSFDNPSTFEAATAGIDRVFLIGPPLDLTLAELLTPFIDFLRSKDIRRIVYASVLASEHLTSLPFHTIISDKLVHDGFDYTILKLAFFAQNFKNYEWDNITQRQITYVTAGKGKAAFIDVNDIARVAAAVLTTAGHSKKTYELTGPETLSYFDAANLLSEVTGKTITYPNPTPQEYTAALKGAGAPDFIAPYMISVYSLIADNHVGFTTNDVQQITGRRPTALREVLINDFPKS